MFKLKFLMQKEVFAFVLFFLILCCYAITEIFSIPYSFPGFLLLIFVIWIISSEEQKKTKIKIINRGCYMPRRKIRKIETRELPAPFSLYWFSEERVNRPEWEFYLVDDQHLYIRSGDNEILFHWTQADCEGVVFFMLENKISEGSMPVVRVNGEHVFVVICRNEYCETRLISPEDGKSFTLHEE